MIDDLRHFTNDDAFQLIPSDLAIVLLVVGTVLGYVLGVLT